MRPRILHQPKCTVRYALMLRSRDLPLPERTTPSLSSAMHTRGPPIQTMRLAKLLAIRIR